MAFGSNIKCHSFIYHMVRKRGQEYERFLIVLPLFYGNRFILRNDQQLENTNSLVKDYVMNLVFIHHARNK